MTTAAFSMATVRLNFVRAVTIASGLNYTFAGLALVAAPTWFYENIGNFPPFNRHYMGDAGTFLLPLGIALLWAVAAPHRYRIILFVNAGVSLLHAFNHLYDALNAGVIDGQTLYLLALGIITLLVALAVQRPEGQSHR